MKSIACFVVLIALVGCGPTERLVTVAPVGSADPTANRTGPMGDAGYRVGDRVDVGAADLVITVPGGHDIGNIIALPGDLDGDGYDDVVIGNSHYEDAMHCVDEPTSEIACVMHTRFAAQIVYGAQRGTPLVQRTAELLTWSSGSVRLAVSGAGDVDGDGHADLLVGYSGYDCAPSNAVLIYGGARLSGTHELRDVGVTFADDTYCSGFGRPAALGDIDGDGYDDFAIGAPGDGHVTGRLHVFHGRAERYSGRVTTDAAVFSLAPAVPNPLGSFGFAAPAGDVDGDGYDDFSVWDETATPPRAFLFRGAPERREGSLPVESSASTLFSNIRLPIAIGDLDGDGRDELALSSWDLNPVVVYGRDSWPAQISPESEEIGLRLQPSEPGQWTYFSRGGDINGDSIPDFLVGDAAYRNGAVSLILGTEGGRRGDLRLEDNTVLILGRTIQLAGMETVPDGTGGPLLGGADIDGDGLDDFVVGVGTPVPASGRTTGTVNVFYGRSAE